MDSNECSESHWVRALSEYQHMTYLQWLWVKAQWNVHTFNIEFISFCLASDMFKWRTRPWCLWQISKLTNGYYYRTMLANFDRKKTVYRRKCDTLFASMCLPITHLTGHNPDEYATDWHKYAMEALDIHIHVPVTI